MKQTTYTQRELALKYNIHYNTFNRWIKKIPGLKLVPYSKLLTPKQVQIIFEHLGLPEEDHNK